MLQSQALKILKTGANVFLTGEPGAGKTHTIAEYVNYLRAHDIEPAITASTGIAATHLGGMTIHSWSGIGIKDKLDRHILNDIAGNRYVKRRVINAKVLIIDEVSMLSANTLDMVDAVCRRLRQDQRPFGGLQVVLVGDFFQLPPIAKNKESIATQTDFINNQNNLFAYNASVWTRANLNICYLTEQYRQDDKDYLNVLTAIRRNNFTDEHLSAILKRKTEKQHAPDNITKLYSHNINVDEVNSSMLNKLSGQSKLFEMTGAGKNILVEILKKGCLSPEKLYLKIEAIVMFTKNNTRAGFVNGTLGKIVGFDKETEYPVVKIRDGKIIDVEPMDWTVEENGEIRAQVSQIPLRLAWAITIHKSQGMSMDAAVMDLSGVFEFGQGYVALSRVRRLSGLYLLGWNERVFQVHPEILEKDLLFRACSTEVLSKLDQLPDEQIFKNHQNFVAACGGTLAAGGNFNVSDVKIKTDNIKAYSVEKIRIQHPNAYHPWDKAQDEKLINLFEQQITFKKMAEVLGRKIGAIRSRLVKMGKMDKS